MSKHTPGPWVYRRTSGFDYGSTAYWVPGVCTNVQTEADARLISAAPDLLEALKEIVQFMRVDFDDLPMAEKVLAAIAKAEGQA